ncbi:MAG: hypothetical protein NWQ19_08205 [Nonlabens sp.]|nr:hypothetical protein [Nonlabens sp.]
MKNLKSILLFVFAAITLISCDKDDDNGAAVVANEFTYQGVTYPLTKGILESFGENENGSFDFDISLFSDGIILDVPNETVTGSGQAVYLDLNSNSMNGLVNGTYNFAIERDAFTIVDGFVATEIDVATQTFVAAQVTAGNVVLTINNGQYTILFNLQDAAGEDIVGSYQGTLTVF